MDKIHKNVYNIHKQASSKESVMKNYFSYFSAKTYVVGTQKNRLNETVLLRTQNTVMFRLMGKKIIIILIKKILILTYANMCSEYSLEVSH